jgi:hypothetical protein
VMQSISNRRGNFERLTDGAEGNSLCMGSPAVRFKDRENIPAAGKYRDV